MTPRHEVEEGHAEGSSKLGRATAFLRATLKDGPVPAREIEQMAEDEGISSRTLKRAKEQLGVQPKKETKTMAGHWSWELPDSGPTVH